MENLNRDRQTEIEEMEIALREAQHAFDRAWKECLHHNAPMPDRENVFYAKYLVENKGYRKASEVAEEIFAEMERILFDNKVIINITRYTELKKKYTESEDTE